MSLSFSQRMGFEPVPNLQIDSMDESLRNGLWNVFYKYLWSTLPTKSSYQSGRVYTLLTGWGMKFFVGIVEDYFQQPIDNINPEINFCTKIVKICFASSSDWKTVYNFIEFICNCSSNRLSQSVVKLIIDEWNWVLEKQMSGYRIVNKLVIPITNEIEISTIENATQSSYDFANQHIQKSVEFLSNRENPDYRNSIKESISAVESICRSQFGGSTLGKALQKIETGSPINGQFKSALQKLYDYTNNEADGIRHAIMDDPQAGFDEAKFMLVTCSAFVNYLVSKAETVK